MGLFRRKHDTIDLTDAATATPTAGPQDAPAHPAAVHAGVPGRCPTCDGFGYIDHIDMVHRYQRQHCRTCGHVWEFTFDPNRETFGIQL